MVIAMSLREDFTDRMAAARDLAAYRRHRGEHTGASAKGWNYSRPKLDPADFYSHVVMARETWRQDKADALNDYHRIVRDGLRPEADYEIPF